MNYLLAAMVALLLTGGCRKQEDAPVTTLPQVDMLNAVNAVRASGCTCGTDSMPPVLPLTWNDTLAQAAAAYALDMYTRNFFSHISPEGTSPIQRAQATGYSGKYVGENIAEGYSDLSSVMKAWLQSEEHCKALMDTLYREMGAGRADGYWVQEFGRK